MEKPDKGQSAQTLSSGRQGTLESQRAHPDRIRKLKEGGLGRGTQEASWAVVSR